MSEVQQAVLHRIGPIVTSEDFYLGGGTAVAIHLGHRRSLDLDWFTGRALTEPLRFAEELRRKGIAFRTEAVERGTLHGSVEGLRLIFLEYRYPTLHPPIPWATFGCRIASLDDLACMKLAAIAQRGSKKDFVDLYALVRAYRPLAELLDCYKARYDVEDIGHVVFALTYFDDADPEPTLAMLWEVEWSEIKASVLSWVKALVAEQQES
ncbi:MAG: nucleotidyl transferase AbiEii/AbiGii toxin family protein [Gemmatimonadetes bacterium]|nr:nucleotidyl transferase AbiEii/AbiGii toxin family protein [Gemmatimonadota bacterium]